MFQVGWERERPFGLSSSLVCGTLTASLCWEWGGRGEEKGQLPVSTRQCYLEVSWIKLTTPNGLLARDTPASGPQSPLGPAWTHLLWKWSQISDCWMGVSLGALVWRKTRLKFHLKPRETALINNLVHKIGRVMTSVLILFKYNWTLSMKKFLF